MKYLKLAIIALIVFGCGQQNQQQATDTIPASNQSPEILPQLKATLDQHGGLDLWNKFGTLSFEEKGVRHTLNLRTRDEVFAKDSAYTVGYNGDQVWVLPDSSAFPRARFYRNLYFYFFSLPFVAADPGVNHEFLGQKTFNGVLYDMVKLSYEANVGDSPDDQYILYIESETKQLGMINYSVTYFDKNRAEQYSAVVYRGWTKVNGLVVPSGFDGYRWENDTLGEKRYEVNLSNISFKNEVPDNVLFQAPEGAYIENSK